MDRIEEAVVSVSSSGSKWTIERRPLFGNVLIEQLPDKMHVTCKYSAFHPLGRVLGGHSLLTYIEKSRKLIWANHVCVREILQVRKYSFRGSSYRADYDRQFAIV